MAPAWTLHLPPRNNPVGQALPFLWAHPTTLPTRIQTTAESSGSSAPYIFPHHQTTHKSQCALRMRVKINPFLDLAFLAGQPLSMVLLTLLYQGATETMLIKFLFTLNWQLFHLLNKTTSSFPQIKISFQGKTTQFSLRCEVPLPGLDSNR